MTTTRNRRPASAPSRRDIRDAVTAHLEAWGYSDGTHYYISGITRTWTGNDECHLVALGDTDAAILASDIDAVGVYPTKALGGPYAAMTIDNTGYTD